MARVYATPPDRQHLVSLRQFRVIQADYQALQQQEGG